MIAAAVASVVLSVGGGPGEGRPIPQDSAVAAVSATLQSQWRAQIARDTVTLRNLLGEDLVYIHSNALVEDKAGFLRTVATGTIVYHDISPLEMTHRVIGATVVGNGRVRVRVGLGGQDLALDLLVTTVHARRDGRWVLVAWQSTRVQ